MKVTVEFSESEMREIRKMTGETKKGPAIRKVVVDALNLRKRREIAQKFISGEWGVELPGYEDGIQKDKAASDEVEKKWRERDGSAN
jgi:hypothetical protein